MGLYKDPLAAILAAIKQLNGGLNLVQGEYTYGLPVPVAPDAAGTNTQLTITAMDTQSTYDGTDTIRYTRLDLADLAILVPLNIRADLPATTWDVAQRLNALYGTNFHPEDIVSTPVTTLVDGAGSVTLTAQTNSLSWIGSVVVNITRGGIPLTSALKVVNLPGLYMPNRKDGRPYGEMYSIFRDMSAWHVDAAAIVVGATDLTPLQTLLINVTGDAWVLTGSGRFTLDGASVVYNGPTSGDPRLKQDYQNGLIVDLSPVQSLGLSGSLLLHYNAPDGFVD